MPVALGIGKPPPWIWAIAVVGMAFVWLVVPVVVANRTGEAKAEVPVFTVRVACDGRGDGTCARLRLTGDFPERTLPWPLDPRGWRYDAAWVSTSYVLAGQMGARYGTGDIHVVIDTRDLPADVSLRAEDALEEALAGEGREFRRP
jgi:hypothetical protein